MEILEVPFPALPAGGVLVRNHYSVISAGTEGKTVKDARLGYLAKARARQKEVKQVLNAVKTSGLRTTYNMVMNKLEAPSALGYSCAGEVIAVGPVEITTPRDGSFEPKIQPRRWRKLSADLDRQIIALYARGSSYGDTRDYLAEMYDLEVSTATISRITDKILPLLHEWRFRPLEAVYPFLLLDAVHY